MINSNGRCLLEVYKFWNSDFRFANVFLSFYEEKKIERADSASSSLFWLFFENYAQNIN